MRRPRLSGWPTGNTSPRRSSGSSAKTAAAPRLLLSLNSAPSPLSVLSYHNRFFRQARDAFVIGAHYPALTGACALGERILNHMVQDLEGSFRSTRQYKLVYDKDSFDDWEKAISVLEAWGVLLPEVVVDFRSLEAQRNAALSLSARDGH